MGHIRQACAWDDFECAPRCSAHSQRNYYLKFRVCRALRSAPNAFSREGPWRETAFAAPLSAKARRCGGALPVCTLIRRYAPPSPDWGKASAAEVQFPAKTQSLRACLRPLGGAVAQRLRGFKSAEPEKTVKRSSRRTGVNLQFFPVQPSSLGLKGASSPFFVAPARRNRCDLAVLNAQHLLRKPVCDLKAPLGLSCLAGTAALFFSFGVKREHPTRFCNKLQKKKPLHKSCAMVSLVTVSNSQSRIRRAPELPSQLHRRGERRS